ncbi:MAG: PQQ-binding-like beta-propeller repeat protein [Verrucomicrobiota bacterium]
MTCAKSLTLILTSILAGSACAENWPQWRGPFFNGSTTETNLPVQWTKTENVAWSLDLPGPSAATPIVWGDHVFISSTDTQAQALLALCLDRKTGKVLWQHKINDGIRKDDRSNFASSSPTTDGKLAFFFYGNGDLTAFDFTGRQVWTRNVQKDFGEFAFLWTFSSSPVLHAGKLYLQILQRDVPVNGRGQKEGPNESCILALEPATGKMLWRQVRPSEAVAESREAFTTPMPYEHNGRKELLVIGGDCLTGHDPETGRELWRWGTWNPTKIGHWRLVTSAVAGDGVILASAPKGDPIYAIKAGGAGSLNDAALAWKSDQQRIITADVPTPLFYQGDFFVLSDVRKALSRVEPQSGKVKWTIEMPGRKKYEASPTGADGKIYCMNFAGDVVVVEAEKGQVLSTIPLGEEGDDFIRSSIAAAQGRLFIRTNTKLYAIGK